MLWGLQNKWKDHDFCPLPLHSLFCFLFLFDSCTLSYLYWKSYCSNFTLELQYVMIMLCSYVYVLVSLHIFMGINTFDWVMPKCVIRWPCLSLGSRTLLPGHVEINNSPGVYSRKYCNFAFLYLFSLCICLSCKKAMLFCVSLFLSVISICTPDAHGQPCLQILMPLFHLQSANLTHSSANPLNNSPHKFVIKQDKAIIKSVSTVLFLGLTVTVEIMTQVPGPWNYLFE